MNCEPDRCFSFPRSRRVVRKRDFDAVFQGGVRTSSGVLVVRGRPNGLAHCRLGLAVPRRLGRAVVRNRMRRGIREAFRLIQAQLETTDVGYDVVVSPRPHDPLPTSEYGEHLMRAIGALRKRWERKRQSD